MTIIQYGNHQTWKDGFYIEQGPFGMDTAGLDLMGIYLLRRTNDRRH